jgi:hypothetical protein
MGVQFVTKTVKKNKLNELMIQQEEELKTIGPLVEWTQNMRIIQKNEKYGISVVMDAEQRKKPFRLCASSSFSCCVSECRGHVVSFQPSENKGKCNVCAKFACMLCQESYHSTTPCDPNTLETLKEIKENTRPCPKCKTNIHRTHGCNHMHCTKCNTHFNYVTGT